MITSRFFNFASKFDIIYKYIILYRYKTAIGMAPRLLRQLANPAGCSIFVVKFKQIWHIQNR